MTILAISFRIDSGDDYSKRYAGVMEYLRGLGAIWEETTSFVLVETTKSAADVSLYVWTSTELSSARDTWLVIDVSGDAGVIRGKLKNANVLASLMPKIRQE